MLALNPDFKELLRCFNSAGARYLILGGYAVNFHGCHRNTKDIDIWVAIDPANAQRVSEALIKFGFAAEGVLPEKFTQPGNVYSFGRAPTRVDILTSPTGIDFADSWKSRIEFEIDGVTIPFISLDHLRANKKASGRPRDIADLAALADASSRKPKSTRRGKKR